MNKSVIVLDNNSLRQQLRNVLTGLRKKVDRGGNEVLFNLWTEWCKKNFIQALQRDDTEIEVLVEKNDKTKVWLMTIPPVEKVSEKSQNENFVVQSSIDLTGNLVDGIQIIPKVDLTTPS